MKSKATEMAEEILKTNPQCYPLVTQCPAFWSDMPQLAVSKKYTARAGTMIVEKCCLCLNSTRDDGKVCDECGGKGYRQKVKAEWFRRDYSDNILAYIAARFAALDVDQKPDFQSREFLIWWEVFPSTSAFGVIYTTLSVGEHPHG